MINNQRNQVGWLALVAGVAVLFWMQTSGWAAPVTIGFASQTNSGAAFVSNTELGFSVTPTLGSWFQSSGFGDPLPSIYAGPVGSPSSSAIEVTDGGGTFTFSSTEFSSNSGTATYFFFGFNGSTLAFEEMGTLPSSGGSGGFNTYATSTADASKLITTLTISVAPGTGTTSINIDDIKVNAVPEPTTTALLGVGGLALTASFRRRNR